jgi:WhiB family redox-sensing transcriptional regulator
MLDDLIPFRPSWMRRAACRGRGVDAFFADEKATQAKARTVCEDCPVRAECLEFALADRTVTGIWAGTDDRERRAIRRERRRAA